MVISEDTITDLQLLRKRGLSVREIANRTGVSSATVHRYVRKVQVRGHHPAEPKKAVRQHRGKRDHGFRKTPGRYIEIKLGRRYHGLLVHLPDPVFCPRCGEESDDVIFCLDCGSCWIGACGHGGEVGDDRHRGFNLGELKRGKGYGDLHVLPLTFQS